MSSLPHRLVSHTGGQGLPSRRREEKTEEATTKSANSAKIHDHKWVVPSAAGGQAALGGLGLACARNLRNVFREFRAHTNPVGDEFAARPPHARLVSPFEPFAVFVV